MRVLFIEDEPAHVEPVIAYLNRKSKLFNCRITDFVSADKEVSDFQPEVVVLDILVGGGSGDPQPEGNRTIDSFWKSRFFPIVVFSAHPDRLTEGEWKAHPFVKIIQKSSSGDKDIETAINSFNPHIVALRKAEDYVRSIFAIAIRAVAPYAFTAFSGEDDIKDAILRSGRRRLAALMDHTGMSDKLACWEAYIYPPISTDVMLGDVLRLTSGKSTDPTSYRIVLTPSCDMDTTGGRKPKVEKILVARCCSIKQGIMSTSLCKHSKEELQKTLTSTILTQGYYQKGVPFPNLKGQIPHMMADMKALEFIQFTNISLDATNTYIRIASLDSPFRELISWAYMQTTGRPGLPDRDFETWNKEIMDSYDA